MTDPHRDYCLRRADEERLRASTSKAPDIAKRHLLLAELYALRAIDPEAWGAISTQENS